MVSFKKAMDMKEKMIGMEDNLYKQGKSEEEIEVALDRYLTEEKKKVNPENKEMVERLG